MNATRPRSVPALTALRIGEGVSAGLAVAALLAGWQAGLNHDLAHGHVWLSADRFHGVLLAPAALGAMASLAMGILVDGLRLSRSAPRRAVVYVLLAAVLAAACWPLYGKVSDATAAPGVWTPTRLRYVFVAAITACGIALVLARAAEIRFGLLSARFRFLAAGLVTAGVVAFAVGFPWALASRARGKPSVILISLDTLRADRVGFMGYRRPTTPALDRFAAEGTVFEQAASVSPWTLPSHASILTSRYPSGHRAIRLGQRLHPREASVAEAMRNAGYRTAAFTGSGYVSTGSHFEQGFGRFSEFYEMKVGGPRAIAADAIAWVRAHRGQPFFLFLHTYEPHGPYTHDDFADPNDRGRLREGRSEFLEPTDHATEPERRYMSDLYDGDILETDRAFGGLLDTLREEGVLTGAIVIVTSDHGEDFWEHDADAIPRHGHSLYEEMLHVPLLVWSPSRGRSSVRIRTPVSLLDIAPTVLDLAGVAPLTGAGGVSLGRCVVDGVEPAPRPLFAEATRYGPARYSLRDDDLKAILTPHPEKHVQKATVRATLLEIFDLAEDSKELHDLSADPTSRARALVATLADYVAAGGPAKRSPETIPEIPSELREHLRSLGYVD